MAADVDTLDTLRRFELELADGAEGARRDFILAVLARWEIDRDLNERSRQLARDILRRFSIEA